MPHVRLHTAFFPLRRGSLAVLRVLAQLSTQLPNPKVLAQLPKKIGGFTLADVCICGH